MPYQVVLRARRFEEPNELIAEVVVATAPTLDEARAIELVDLPAYQQAREFMLSLTGNIELTTYYRVAI